MVEKVGGAGGNWPRSNERRDERVVTQQGSLYCGCACALTLLKLIGLQDLPTQEELYAAGGFGPLSVESLSAVLNDCGFCEGRWTGQGTSPPEGKDYTWIVRTLSDLGPWIAFFQEPLSRVGHFIVVAAVSESIEILDPWEPGTAYEMTMDEFMGVWNYQAVYLIRRAK
ncbi:MAG TPA: papain-like cysteine protease family protein [Blastocatellia bacterium]|nr:papain-like cysteine protease family protein [Blastocatellia bacterium]